MRILHLNSMLKGGGTDDQCVKLAIGLRELGQEVWLAGPAHRDFARHAREGNLPMIDTGVEGPLKWRLMLRAAKAIRANRAHIVHGHHGRDLWPTVLAARLSGIRPKIVLTRHLAKSPGSAFSRRFLLSQCDSIIAVSRFVASVLKNGHHDPSSPELERHHRPPMTGDHEKISVIYGGIETDRFIPMPSDAANVQQLRASWGLKPEDYAFGMVGGYDAPRGKGQREFLKAAAIIHATCPRTRFVIVGRGSMRETLQADIQALGLEGKAFLAPYCNEMPLAMNAIDCLVHPQIGTEAMPGVVCEAFACGKPVIASDLDGIPEAFALGGVGALVTPEDVVELSAKLLEQAKKPILAHSEQMKLHYGIVKNFSLRGMAERTLAHYRRLLPTPAP